MPSGILTLAMGVAMQVASPGPSENPYTPALPSAYGQYGSEGSSEQRSPFDSQRNWVHGYFQELPAYGGHPVFRPYNYKHVLSQSQAAAGWGERPTMPYSQQFWHKYHDQATMLKTTYNMPPRSSTVWTPATSSSSSLHGYAGNPVTQGSAIAIPQSSTVSYSGPYHVPPQGMIVLPDQQRIQLPPATEVVNPAGYQPNYGRGY